MPRNDRLPPFPDGIALPWVHRVFASLKNWALGVFDRLRRQYLQSYLDKFVFRLSRGHTRHAAFRSILGLGLAIKPTTYRILIVPEERLCCSFLAYPVITHTHYM